MTPTSRFIHPLEQAALELARRWCAGNQIGNQRAIAHSYEVADTLRHHVPDVAPEVIAAVLLHDSPEFAPPQVDMYSVLTTRLAPEVARIVAALAAEHDSMDPRALHTVIQDPPVLVASTADKIVSMTAVLDRPNGPRPAFVSALGYFRAFSRSAGPLLPTSMASELAALVERSQRDTLA